MSNFLENNLKLMQERDSFLCQPKTLLADIVLLSYVNDVLESVQAAMSILQLETIPSRAFACLRTSFEAAQQGMVLVTQDDYAFMGAKAWVYYCRRDKKWLTMNKPVESGINTDDDAKNWFEQKLVEIAELWDGFSLGQGVLVAQARDELEKHRSKPDNWLGKDMALSQDEAYSKIGAYRKSPINQNMSLTNRSIYGALCRDAHTGLRINSSIFFEIYPNGIKASVSKRDNALLLDIASTSALLSVSEMLLALDYRQHLQIH